MIDLVSTGSSLITGFIGGFLAHMFASKRNRENDLSRFKLQAYSDFIGAASKVAAARRTGNIENDLDDLSKMNDAKNRIILSGDKLVVEAMIKFWERGGSLELESELLAFRNMTVAMRESLGHSKRGLAGVELTATMFRLEPATYSYRAEKASEKINP
jgi:hypothetical protein